LVAAGAAADRTAKRLIRPKLRTKNQRVRSARSDAGVSIWIDGGAAGACGAARLGGLVMRQFTHSLSIRAPSRGLHEITRDICGWVDSTACAEGLLTLFCRHTSASLLIQENAAPAVVRDLEAYFSRIAPEGGPYEHDDEGPDDMPAHLRTALTQVQLTIPVSAGRPVLGTWQGIFLFEHRRNTPERQIALHLVGE
jgi:secondary thiamine-phosphate synthase enzyme